eukprot:COSAG01_NODE_2934_length_6829_cov_7.598217_4_plen_56_part_00
MKAIIMIEQALPISLWVKPYTVIPQLIQLTEATSLPALACGKWSKTFFREMITAI